MACRLHFMTLCRYLFKVMENKDADKDTLTHIRYQYLHVCLIHLHCVRYFTPHLVVSDKWNEKNDWYESRTRQEECKKNRIEKQQPATKAERRREKNDYSSTISSRIVHIIGMVKWSMRWHIVIDNKTHSRLLYKHRLENRDRSAKVLLCVYAKIAIMI